MNLPVTQPGKQKQDFFFYDGLPRDHLTNHRDNKMVEICISVCCAFAFCLPTSIIQNLSFLWREGARGLILSQVILLFSVNTCVEKGWSCADPLVSHFAWLLFFPVKVQNWKSHALCLGVACLSSLTNEIKKKKKGWGRLRVGGWREILTF